jgi:hypothetical protein
LRLEKEIGSEKEKVAKDKKKKNCDKNETVEIFL